MNSDEIEKRNIAAMGDHLGKQYSALFQEVGRLNLYWKEFLELFGTNEKRIERMNRSAPNFFSMLQGQQFETNVLHIARLTDPPETAGKKNLTVRNLPLLVTDQSLQDQLTKLLEKALDKTKFCRDWRNRQFAHADLALALQDRLAKPLEAATKERMNAAVSALSDVLNAMERHYFKGGCSFDDIAAHNGVMTLLFTLGFGVNARDEMEAKIKAGHYDNLGQPEQI
jgi:AbiU2